MPTFNGETLVITLDAGVSEVNAKVDLYSDWKEWAKTGTNMKYQPAFDTTGGDPTTATGKVAPFYFLRNDLGWRIRPAEENGNTTITGNLYPRDPSLPMLIPTIGSFTAMVSMERDASSVVETVTSGSGLSADQNTWLDELHRLQGLRSGVPLTVSETQRQAGAVTQSISEAGGTVTVTRQ